MSAALKSILLVEDSPDDVIIFLEVFRKSLLPNPVMVVRDGDDAIDYLKHVGQSGGLKTNPLPSVLFLDWKLPKVGGVEVLRWIKTQPHLKTMLVVVLTHYQDVKILSEAYELGAHSFLTKPLTLADLKNLTSHYQAFFNGNGHSSLPNVRLGPAV